MTLDRPPHRAVIDCYCGDAGHAIEREAAGPEIDVKLLADALFWQYGDDVRDPIGHDWEIDALAIAARLQPSEGADPVGEWK